jgi:hypothetical protein
MITSIIHIVLAYIYDAYKFIKTTSSIRLFHNVYKLRAMLLRQSHGLEKAFSLPEIKKIYGVVLLKELIKNYSSYVNKFGRDDITEIVESTIKTYKVHLSQYSDDESRNTLNQIHALLIQNNFPNIDSIRLDIAGANVLNRSEILKIVNNSNFKAFVNCRYSVRDFEDSEVDENLILEAVKIAKKTPSHCNRQPWIVRIFTGIEKDDILKYQNGNRGFGHSIKLIILVLGNRSFFSHKERNAVFIDGGMYSMNLIFALHSLGLATCPLNTSYSIKDELNLRDYLNLELNLEPIMMIGVGNYKESFQVAKSPRI